MQPASAIVQLYRLVPVEKNSLEDNSNVICHTENLLCVRMLKIWTAASAATVFVPPQNLLIRVLNVRSAS